MAAALRLFTPWENENMMAWCLFFLKKKMLQYQLHLAQYCACIIILLSKHLSAVSIMVMWLSVHVCLMLYCDCIFIKISVWFFKTKLCFKYFFLWRHHDLSVFTLYHSSVYSFLQVTLCNVTPVWAPTTMTAIGKVPNPVPATLMPVLQWWAMTVSPTVTVE